MQLLPFTQLWPLFALCQIITVVTCLMALLMPHITLFFMYFFSSQPDRT